MIPLYGERGTAVPIERILEYFGRSMTNGGRSTVITDLVWIIGILATTAVFSAPFLPGLAYAAAGMLGLVVIVVVAVYGYCFYYGNLDALRSERLQVLQTAMAKRGYRGDDLRVIMDAFSERDATPPPALPAPPREGETS